MAFAFAPLVSELETKYKIPSGLYSNLLLKGERSGQRAVSPKGAVGFAQLMPGTARELGVDPWDPEQNLEGGARYFRSMLDMFNGDPKLALAAYNAGAANVKKAGGIPNFPETQDYVRRVMGMSEAPGTAQPAGGAPPVGGVDQVLMDRAQKGLDHSEAVGADIEKQLQESHARMQAIQDEAHAAMAVPRPKPPTLQDLPDSPQKDDYIKDPQRVLGQTLPLIAILGSLGTRNGAVNAMRSASAAMNAARANDKDAFAQAHQEWKDNMDQIIATNDQERQRYLDIMEDRKMSLQEKLSELQVQTAVDGNSQMQALVANGQLGELYKFIQMRDANVYRAAQVYDMSQRRDIDRDRLALERDKLAALTDYRQGQQDLARARVDKTSLSQFIGQQMARKVEMGAAWTPELQQILEEAQSTYQRTNWGADGSAPAAPATAGAPAAGPPIAALALPKTQAELKPGVVYMTARGPAKWNGKQFVAAGG